MFPDYLTFSVPVPVAEDLLSSLHSSWTTKRSLSAFYAEKRQCGGVAVSLPANPAAAARVEVSGSGCRELEAAGVVTDWQTFLQTQLADEAKFTRLDFAMDDRSGLLCLDNVFACCEEQRVVSRFQEINFHPKVDAATGDTIGRGVSFGKRGSRTYVRLYDKALQMGVPGPWIRVELEMRKENAHRLAEAIAKDGAAAVPPVLLSYLDFKEQGAAMKRSCWKTADWWTSFLGTAERRRLETAPRNVSLETTHNWLMRNVSPSFARVHDSGMYERLYSEMLTCGRQKQRNNSAETIIR